MKRTAFILLVLALCISLCACDSSEYNEAMDLFNEGNYESALVIFESLDIKTNMEILDLGCGFGKLWRNNWEQIPENVKIDAVDLKGSWAENFEEFVTEHKKSLPENCNINLFWGDVENADVWKALPQKQYDC